MSHLLFGVVYYISPVLHNKYTHPYCTFCILYLLHYKPHAHVSFVLEYKEAEYKLKKQWYNVVEQHYHIY